MTFNLLFNGTVQTPNQIGCADSCGAQFAGSGCSSVNLTVGFSFKFTPTAQEFAQVLTTEYPFAGDSVNWAELKLTRQFSSVEFLALSLAEGSQPVDLLIGAPPLLTGSGGTFPTGFTGGETLTLFFYNSSVITLTVVVTFTSADQTALQCAARINSALAYNGLLPVCSVVSGQLQIQGTVPGAAQTISTLGNAVLGFASKVVRGTGDALKITSNYLVSSVIPGSYFWVRGGGGSTVINVLAAGS